MTLPPFPTDDTTLDLIEQAIKPGVHNERTSLLDLCEMYASLAGADPAATDGVIGSIRGEPVMLMRDPSYFEHDIIEALIGEVRRLRKATRD
jgi:hypothetical protein